ncbi:MAG: hypothetical protein U0936_23625 [Planctomycetaceae bacterium]
MVSRTRWRERQVQEIMRFLERSERHKAEIAKRQAEIDAAAAAAATLEEAKKGLLETIKNQSRRQRSEVMTNRRQLRRRRVLTLLKPLPKFLRRPKKLRWNQKNRCCSDGRYMPKVKRPTEKAEGTEPAPDEAKNEVPAGPRYMAPATLIERIERYATAIGGKPTVEGFAG